MQKSETVQGLPRIWRLLKRPWHEKAIWFRSLLAAERQWRLEKTPRILDFKRLPFGAWWIVRDDDCGRAIRDGSFERAEASFVGRFLEPGMTVLDLGAHHGFYTLLASKRVGPTGRVFSFEPSPRERRALRLHKLLNRCANVLIQELALGSEEKEAEFHVVAGKETGCNSLRPPAADINARTSRVNVKVVRLDDWLSRHKIARVDFVKLDVEGGELPALLGASELLQRRPRPVILAEVQDVRTLQWGYRAKEIVEFLSGKGYRWFELTADGTVKLLNTEGLSYEGNFIACPEECLSLLKVEGMQDHVPKH